MSDATCPACGTKLLHAPGIGDFCPNHSCDVVDGPDVWPDKPRFVRPVSPAAALAAKDARIAELEAETELRWRQYQALGAETHARIAELEEALRPFAAASKRFDDAATNFLHALAPDHVCPRCEFTHAELRRARAVLEKG